MLPHAREEEEGRPAAAARPRALPPGTAAGPRPAPRAAGPAPRPDGPAHAMLARAMSSCGLRSRFAEIHGAIARLARGILRGRGPAGVCFGRGRVRRGPAAFACPEPVPPAPPEASGLSLRGSKGGGACAKCAGVLCADLNVEFTFWPGRGHHAVRDEKPIDHHRHRWRRSTRSSPRPRESPPNVRRRGSVPPCSPNGGEVGTALTSSSWWTAAGTPAPSMYMYMYTSP